MSRLRPPAALLAWRRRPLPLGPNQPPLHGAGGDPQGTAPAGTHRGRRRRGPTGDGASGDPQGTAPVGTHRG